jgi:hypothetical protein
MTGPHELEQGDVVTIYCEALKGVECEVSDVQVEDIGITETFAVTLLTDAESNWALVGTTSDSVGTLNEINGDGKQRINFNDIVVK